MKKALLTITTMLTMLVAHGQTTPKELTDQFFELLPSAPEWAIRQVRTPLTCTSEKSNQMDSLKAHYQNLIPQYGRYLSHEKIKEETIGESVIILTYLVKYNCCSVRLTLVLYQANEDWEISNLYIDDDFGDN